MDMGILSDDESRCIWMARVLRGSLGGHLDVATQMKEKLTQPPNVAFMKAHIFHCNTTVFQNFTLSHSETLAASVAADHIHTATSYGSMAEQRLRIIKLEPASYNLHTNLTYKKQYSKYRIPVIYQSAKLHAGYQTGYLDMTLNTGLLYRYHNTA